MNPILHNPMIDLVVRLLAGQPTLWWAAWIPPLVIVFGAFHLVKPQITSTRVQRAVTGSAAFVIVVIYVGVSWLHMLSARYLDQIEPNVASISWQFAIGRPVYHSLDSAESYSNLYGPALYVLNGLVLRLFGASVPVSKLVGVLAANLALVFTFLTVKKQANWLDALIGVGVMVSVFLTFATASFFTRAEPVLILCTSLALFAVTGPPTALRAMLFGLVFGLAMNLKIHGAVYLLPAVALGVSVFSRRDLLKAAVVAAVVASMPFWFSNVSFGGYVALLRLAATHGLNPGIYLLQIRWLVTLAVPALFLLLWASVENAAAVVQSVKANRWLLIATGIAVVIVLFPASKNGAGPHHLLPFFPVFLFVGAQLLRDGVTIAWRPAPLRVLVDAAVYSWLLSVFIVALWSGRDLRAQTTGVQQRTSASVLTDIDRIYAAYGGRYDILMGVGSEASYALTWYRPQLIFKTGLVGVDPAALMDLQLAGRTPPNLSRLEASFNSGRSRHKPLLWLIPESTMPFSMQSFYPSDITISDLDNRPPLFTPAFRSEFEKHFTRVKDSSPFYDLYAESGT